MPHLFRYRVKGLEGTRLLRNVTFHHAYNLPCIYLDILLANAVAHTADGDRCTKRAFAYLVHIMQVTGSRTVEFVSFYKYALCQTYDGGHNTSCRSKESLARNVAFLQIGHFYDGKVYLSIKATAQTLCHVPQVHIFVVYLSKVGISAEVLVGRKWRTELDGMSCSHVTFYALRSGCSCQDPDLERSASLMFCHCPFGQFTKCCLGNTVGGKTAQANVVLVVYHCSRFCSSQSCICHFIVLSFLRMQSYTNLFIFHHVYPKFMQIPVILYRFPAYIYKTFFTMHEVIIKK